MAVLEAPDNKAMAKISAFIRAQGNFEAENLPAIPAEEFEKSIKF